MNRPASMLPAPVLGTPPGTGRSVAALLPLTGQNASVGQAMQQAIQLVLAQPGSPPLDVRDTGGTAAGAASAARAALAGGDGLILGPLTAAETAAVAPIAQAAAVPVLAFTSDSAQARPGVWPLGVTPEQQVRRLVGAVQAEGKTRIAAVLPQNAFGDALANGLAQAAGEAQVRRYAPADFASLDAAMKDVADYANRRGAIEARQQAARASNDPEGRRAAAQIGQEAPPPPPFDALLLGTVGDQLVEVAPLLTAYDIRPDQLRIMGPALWERDAARLPPLAGAWFAAPDPATRQPFIDAFTAKYGAPPRPLASLAYDAAGLARAAAGPAGFEMGSLVRPEGFAGADGVLALTPDGHVRRGLAIFQVDAGRSHVVEPAPQTLAAPGV